MLNIKYTNEKESVNINKKSDLLLVEIEGIKNKSKVKSDRQKLNLSLVIDISGSMAGQLSYNNQLSNRANPIGFNNKANPLVFNGYFENPLCFNAMTKLELVKKAAINAIEKMNIGDYLSIVLFDDKTDILFEARELTPQIKEEMIQRVKLITTKGGTDLHAGWFVGATEVAKVMKEKFMNRVLILTDGITYSGILDDTVICENVKKIFNKGISTTTFGVGSDFNEDLLQKMAQDGGGNFYYIKDEKDFDDVFEQEFSGLLNIAGSDVSLKIDLVEGIKINKQLNGFELKDNTISMSDISGGKTISLLFDIETNFTKGIKTSESFKLGTMILEYKNEDGSKVQNIIEMKVSLCKNKKWESLPCIQEVKVQEMLLTIAENKLNAAEMLSSGDRAGARAILMGASAMAASTNSSFSDNRLSSLMTTLESNIEQTDTLTGSDFKKGMAYESYRSRTGKDI